MSQMMIGMGMKKKDDFFFSVRFLILVCESDLVFTFGSISKSCKFWTITTSMKKVENEYH